MGTCCPDSTGNLDGFQFRETHTFRVQGGTPHLRADRGYGLICQDAILSRRPLSGSLGWAVRRSAPHRTSGLGPRGYASPPGNGAHLEDMGNLSIGLGGPVLWSVPELGGSVVGSQTITIAC